MKKTDIKRHLTTYSIYSKRSSTITHAFASALSVADIYDEDTISKAIKILEQNPNKDLYCAYCDKPAHTWDHINAIVENKEYSGHGHQISNLIPCCKNCNSAKGNKDWKQYLRLKGLDSDERIKRIERYIDFKYLDSKSKLTTDDLKEDMKIFNDIKAQVLELLKKGDIQAEIIRNKLIIANK